MRHAAIGFSDGFLAVVESVLRFARQGGRNFDTPVDALFSNGSLGVREGSGCVDRQVRVSLLLAAQHGGLAPGDWGGLLVRWWFENSRAYLYYFFIVNDCQSIVRFSRVGSGREACEGRWGFRAMRLSL